MCEVLPEVENCCLVLSYRIGMLLISVLAMITGSLTLSILERNTNASYDNLKSVAGIREPGEALSQISSIIPSGITTFSILFMILGLVLLIATLTDQEGIVQLFVVGMMVTVFFGFLMVLAIGFECMYKNTCLLSSMDWLSGSTFLIMLVAYLFLWVYFAIVANSYVLNGN